jgi:hypothetical protein
MPKLCHASLQTDLSLFDFLSVVNSNYEKYAPVFGPQPDPIQNDQRRQAFIYINYDIDTIYVHGWGLFERMQESCLSKAKHLAWRACELLLHQFDWDVLRAACPSMESITLIGTQNRDFRYHDKEWMLFDIPAGFETSMVLPQWDRGWDYDQLEDALDDYGRLALKCAEAILEFPLKCTTRLNAPP